MDSVAEIASIQASQFFQAEFSFNNAIQANIQDGARRSSSRSVALFCGIHNELVNGC